MRKKPTRVEKTGGGRAPARGLSIAEAVRRAVAAETEPDTNDPYLRNAAVAAHAIRLLLPHEEIKDDELDFGVAFTWPDVPSPIKLVRAFMEQRDAAAIDLAAVLARPANIEPFVYGVIYDRLYVVPRRVAEQGASLCRALNTAETWGELKRQVSPDLYKEALDVLGRRRMAGDTAIDHEALAEEGFPPSLGSVMKRHLPAELEDLVRVEESALGDELPYFLEDSLPHVLALFKARGIPCTEERALVARAAGYAVDDSEGVRQ